MKTLYLQGLPLQHIAHKLNRTLSALNKALARYGIRDVASSRKKRHAPRSYFSPHQWVDMKTVVGYVKSQYRVKALPPPTSLDQPAYVVNHELCTVYHMLILANKIRAERREPTYMVPNITW
jgi:hypothetical protein